MTQHMTSQYHPLTIRLIAFSFSASERIRRRRCRTLPLQKIALGQLPLSHSLIGIVLFSLSFPVHDYIIPWKGIQVRVSARGLSLLFLPVHSPTNALTNTRQLRIPSFSFPVYLNALLNPSTDRYHVQITRRTMPTVKSSSRRETVRKQLRVPAPDSHVTEFSHELTKRRILPRCTRNGERENRKRGPWSKLESIHKKGRQM